MKFICKKLKNPKIKISIPVKGYLPYIRANYFKKYSFGDVAG